MIQAGQWNVRFTHYFHETVDFVNINVLNAFALFYLIFTFLLLSHSIIIIGFEEICYIQQLNLLISMTSSKSFVVLLKKITIEKL